VPDVLNDGRVRNKGAGLVKKSAAGDVQPVVTVASMSMEDTSVPFELAPDAAADRDPDIFIEMVKRYDRLLRGLVYRLMGNREQMDDVLQEVYLRAFRALPGFRGEAGSGTWLYRIAYNVCIDELRRVQRRPSVPLQDFHDEPDGAPDPSDLAALRGDLADALADLPMDQRAAILLVDAHGFDYARAGEILGVPPGTVGSRVSRARSALRLALGGERA
jgi:RNA polymerase sigma-70 factor (ECF subfamily)